MDRGNSMTILVVDDDPDDRMMTKEAFEENCLNNRLDFAEDGEELLAYLNRDGKYKHLKDEPLPGLILLDLNMPRMDGREALQIMKANPLFCRLPVVILTTSESDEDIVRTYGLGVSSFITKPVTFGQLVNTVSILGQYWIEIVALPPECRQAA